MNLSEKIAFCRVCENRKFDRSIGVICGLTNAKPEFEEKCDHIVVDKKEAELLLAQKGALKEPEVEGGFFGAEKRGIKKGVLGGVGMLAIALVWFFVGLAAGYIFYYPPILAVIGIVAIVKGLAEGNISGKKYKEAV